MHRSIVANQTTVNYHRATMSPRWHKRERILMKKRMRCNVNMARRNSMNSVDEASPTLNKSTVEEIIVCDAVALLWVLCDHFETSTFEIV
jgi:hypothetical protein